MHNVCCTFSVFNSSIFLVLSYSFFRTNLLALVVAKIFIVWNLTIDNKQFRAVNLVCVVYLVYKTVEFSRQAGRQAGRVARYLCTFRGKQGRRLGSRYQFEDGGGPTTLLRINGEHSIRRRGLKLSYTVPLLWEHIVLNPP